MRQIIGAFRSSMCLGFFNIGSDKIEKLQINQKQIKQLGFNRIWDPYSIGTENAQNIL